MNVVDSSGWLEYFAGSENAEAFGRIIEKTSELIVPAVTCTEVFKRILQQRGEQPALQAAAHMNRGHVVPLDFHLALQAAKLGHDLHLPLADSIILATARHYHAILWTQDEDFKKIEGVRYFPKK